MCVAGVGGGGWVRACVCVCVRWVGGWVRVWGGGLYVCVCMCVCVRACECILVCAVCVRASSCVRQCVCVRAYVRACVGVYVLIIPDNKRRSPNLKKFA